MEDQTAYVRALETKITRHQSGAGYLEVHTKFVAGEKVLEAFTLASLAEVLDMPMTTMEGRYARARLHYWKVDIPSGSGRPVRGFPMALLAQVVEMIRTPGACVKHSPNGDSITKPKRTKGLTDLVPTYYNNKPHFTISALADYYGYSSTTIRNKLQKAGLMRRLVNIGSSAQGGRPTRAIPESALGDVELAIVDGVKFMTEVDRIIASTGRQRAEAKEHMKGAIAPHTPPAPLRTFDPAAVEGRGQVIPWPVNAVNPRRQSDTFDSAALADEVAAELDAIFASAKAPDHETTPLATDRQPTTTVPSPSEVEDPHVIARRMWEMQLEALADQAEEPTPAEYRETCEMLALDKAASERFVAEVKLARQTRETN